MRATFLTVPLIWLATTPRLKLMLPIICMTSY
jgi:hypothetical protein